MELLDIYNENKEYIGEMSRKEVHKTGAWHFTIHAWLYDEDSIYFARRTDSKKLYTTASGHVQAKETLKEAFAREIKEEIGLDISWADVKIIDVIKWQAKKEKNGEINIDNAFAHITISYIKNKELSFNFEDEETISVVKINTKELEKLFNNKYEKIQAYEYIDEDFALKEITLNDFLVYKNDETPKSKYGEVLKIILKEQQLLKLRNKK